MLTARSERTAEPRPVRALPLHRLHMLRFGYAFMAVGPIAVKWPLFFKPPRS